VNEQKPFELPGRDPPPWSPKPSDLQPGSEPQASEQGQRARLLALHATLCDRARGLMARKNADYAGQGSDDPLVNFRHAERLGLCPNAGASILVRMTDKMSRLATAVRRPLEVSDESAMDTILDMINYSVLLARWFEENKNG
jgi:hypothetical protein